MQRRSSGQRDPHSQSSTRTPAGLGQFIGRAYTAYELHLLRAIIALAQFDDCDCNMRLNYISALSSLDGTWAQAFDEIPPLVEILGDRCPIAVRHLQHALKHLKTATRALRLRRLE